MTDYNQTAPTHCIERTFETCPNRKLATLGDSIIAAIDGTSPKDKRK